MLDGVARPALGLQRVHPLLRGGLIEHLLHELLPIGAGRRPRCERCGEEGLGRRGEGCTAVVLARRLLRRASVLCSSGRRTYSTQLFFAPGTNFRADT